MYCSHKESIVTVGDSTATDTLGIYQPLNWARLAEEHEGGYHNRGEPHLPYEYNIFIEILHQGTSQHMVWHYKASLVQYQYIRHQNRASNQIFTTEHQYRAEPLWIKENQYQSLGLTKKPIIHYIINCLTLL